MFLFNGPSCVAQALVPNAQQRPHERLDRVTLGVVPGSDLTNALDGDGAACGGADAGGDGGEAEGGHGQLGVGFGKDGPR